MSTNCAHMCIMNKHLLFNVFQCPETTVSEVSTLFRCKFANPKQHCLGFLFICFGFFGLFFFYKEFILQRIRKEFSWQPSQQANLVLTFPNSTVINFNTLNEASESEVYLEFCFYNFSDHCVM